MERKDIRQAMRELKEMLDEGLIHESEYEEERRQLMGQWRQSVASVRPEVPAPEQRKPAPPAVEGADFFGTGGVVPATFVPASPGPSFVSGDDEKSSSSPAWQKATNEASGQTLMGRYRLEHLLGEGGMGQVYQAYDMMTDESVALKVVRPAYASEQGLRERFLQELKITRKLTHRGIVRTHALQLEPSTNTLFFTMELLEGKTLEQLLKLAREKQASPPFTLPFVLALVEKLADILDYAHGQGVVHRDLKPGNVMYLDNHEVKLMDFGIAKALSGAHSVLHTGFVGTVYYMSPEQMRGGKVTAASDIFSLGVMVYELLTGELPIGHIESVTSLVPSLPCELDAILHQAISIRASERFSSAGAFLAELKNVSGPALSTVEATPPEQEHWFSRVYQAGAEFVEHAPETAQSKWKEAVGVVESIQASVSEQAGTAFTRTSVSEHCPPWIRHASGSQPCRFGNGTASGPGTLPRIPEAPHRQDTEIVLAHDGSPLLELIQIPEGPFMMGSSTADTLADKSETPQHIVHLDSYWIARTPVTNGMWNTFLKESGYNPARVGGGLDYLKHWEKVVGVVEKKTGWFSKELVQNKALIFPEALRDHPVTYVSYQDAWEFCLFYGLVLPSEAQWEKAARGTDGRFWPWGNNPPTSSFANFEHRVSDTTPVGQHRAGISPFGLLDCAGNCWEWCADSWNASWYQSFPKEARNVLHKGDKADESYVCRGGNFNRQSGDLRCARRYGCPSHQCFRGLGFRPAFSSS